MYSATVLFAQDIQNITDTSHILLPTTVARQVLVDLEEGDRNKLIVEKQNEIIVRQTDLLGLDSCIIENMKEQLRVQSTLHAATSEIVQIQEKEIDSLNKELKKEKTARIIFESTTFLVVLGLIVSLIVK